MAEIFNGHCTARAGKPPVLFLIGMRLNKLWAVHKWLPVSIAMPRMLADLDRKPEAGLLSHRLYMSPHMSPRKTTYAEVSCRLGREKRRRVAFLARAC